jgi:2-amino-4-hydroxy-6-hydroxymethyldihydropteridine diphosphokinase
MTGAVRAYVGLGANLGDAMATVAEALVALGALPGTTLVARSSFYRSAPIDAGGPDFVNAVAAFDTTLAPAELLQHLHIIEAAAGRVRPYVNAPRTLDLDLLLYGDSVVDDAGLTLPHPRLHERRFVLVPLLELAPALVHPLHGALAPWAERAADQRLARIDQATPLQ